MAGKARRLARRAFLILIWTLAAVFLLSCAAPYLDPARWWLVSFLGLGFAATLLSLLLGLVFALVIKPRYALILLGALILGIPSIAVFFALNTGSGGKVPHAPGARHLRVVQWNVARFIEQRRNNNQGSQTRQKMLEQIRAQNADILCFQEFSQATDSDHYDNLGYVRETLGYKYFYFPRGAGFKNWYGQAIFSRYPLIDSGFVAFPRPGTPEKLVWADVVIGRSILRVYTGHLQSYKLEKDDYERIEKIKNREDSLIPHSLSLWEKLRRATVLRAEQARIVRQQLDRCNYPMIVTGDLNDVPNSYTYHHVRGDLQDAFLEKGFGIGRTFNGLAPTLRIDYIFATDQFKIHRFQRIARTLSDHYMLVADLEWKR
ncbi:endonuclease/exonuclease/phosphatase family protein [Flaviaesturariibacter amylovorans]|uniref:Endonuclease/exonuclease/phosphatase domain-containing protein n=1 Tax=Flaviaesturariibacter amylovorans TaxID=1084520 RepID=A0ABP8HUL5_9BACT